MRKITAQKLLKKVQNDYNQIATEFSDTRKYNWKEFFFFKKYLFPEAKILDLGCGNGRLLNYLYQNYPNNNFKYIGIDNSIKLLNEATKLYPKNNFLNGDQLQIPLEDNSVDIIFCIAAFHHLPSHDLRLDALYEMNRVVKPGGKIIITVWNLWQSRYLKNILSAILRSFISFFDFAPNDLFISWKHYVHRYYHAFIPSELKRLIKHSKLKLIILFGTNKDKKTSFYHSRNFCLILKKE